MFDPKIDESFREYAELELQRHFLLLSKKEDSEGIDLVESRMEQLWPAFDETQKLSLKSMASDLNWIRRNGQAPPKGRKTSSEVVEADRRGLEAAMKSKDWHRVLYYLRLCDPLFRPSSIAFERSIAYEGIGLNNYAKVFHSGAIGFESPLVGEAGIGGSPIFSRTATVLHKFAIPNKSRNCIVVTNLRQPLRKGESFPYVFPSETLQAA